MKDVAPNAAEVGVSRAIGALTCAGSDRNDTDGIVDGHAYSLIAVKRKARVRCCVRACAGLHHIMLHGRSAESTTS